MRPGHHRPLGTTTRMRFSDWPRTIRPPELGDVVCQESGPLAGDADDVQRAYLVVGIAETATGYRLTMERVAWGTVPDSLDPDAIWMFYNAPRR